jgi:hypothetical protein
MPAMTPSVASTTGENRRLRGTSTAAHETCAGMNAPGSADDSLSSAEMCTTGMSGRVVTATPSP